MNHQWHGCTHAENPDKRFTSKTDGWLGIQSSRPHSIKEEEQWQEKKGCKSVRGHPSGTRYAGTTLQAAGKELKSVTNEEHNLYLVFQFSTKVYHIISEQNLR